MNSGKLILPIYHLTNDKVYKEEDLISSWGSYNQLSYIVIGKKKPKLYLKTHCLSYDTVNECEDSNMYKQYLGVIKNIEYSEVKE